MLPPNLPNENQISIYPAVSPFSKRKKDIPTNPTTTKTDEVKNHKLRAPDDQIPEGKKNKSSNHAETSKKKLKKSLDQTLQGPVMDQFAKRNLKGQRELLKRSMTLDIDDPYNNKKRLVITNGSEILDEYLAPFDVKNVSQTTHSNATLPIDYLFSLLRNMDKANHAQNKLHGTADFNYTMIEQHAQARVLLYYFLSQMFSGTDAVIDIMNTSLQIWKGKEAQNTEGCHHSYLPSVEDNAMDRIREKLIENLIQSKDSSVLNGHNILLLVGLGIEFGDIVQIFHSLENIESGTDIENLVQREVEKLWAKYQFNPEEGHKPKTINKNTAFHYLNNHTLVAPKLVNLVDNVLEAYLRQYSLKVLNDASQFAQNVSEDQAKLLAPIKVTEAVSSETLRLLSEMEDDAKLFLKAQEEFETHEKVFSEKGVPKAEDGLNFVGISRKIEYLQSFYDSYMNIKQSLEQMERLTSSSQFDVSKFGLNQNLSAMTQNQEKIKSATVRWIELLDKTPLYDQFKTSLDSILELKQDALAKNTVVEREKVDKCKQEIENMQLWIHTLESPLEAGFTPQQQAWKKEGEALGFNRKQKYKDLQGDSKIVHANWEKAITREELVSKFKSEDPAKKKEALHKQKIWSESYQKKLTDKNKELEGLIDTLNQAGNRTEVPALLNEKVKQAILYLNKFVESYGKEVALWSSSPEPKPIWVTNPSHYSNILRIIQAQKKGTATVMQMLNDYQKNNVLTLTPEETRVIFFSRTLQPVEQKK